MAVGTLQTDYAGRRGPLFRLALVSSLLTVLTLGIYRFWMKTRLRRFYWSAIRPGGVPLEYVGLPLEKLLGFLIAVVFLAFYIGIVNLVLMYFSFSLASSNLWAYAISFVGVLPLLFYARYRARRYILARTRWRGIRFGMEPGAWGYVWRALAHWLVTILSLGLLWPRMTFWLEKYRADHTWFGDQAVVQGGRWQMLYKPFLPILVAVALAVASTVAIGMNNLSAGVLLIGLAVVLAGFGLVHYRVHSFRLLTNAKRIGGMGFVSRPRTLRMVAIYLFGYGLVAICSLLTVLVLFAAFVALAAGLFGVDFSSQDAVEAAKAVPLWLSAAFGVASYFLLFMLWGVLRQVFVTMPQLRHYAETLEITGAPSLGAIRQRHRDEMHHAEGFAEALDVGAAI